MRLNVKTAIVPTVSFALALVHCSAVVQGGEDVQIKVTAVAGSVHMLEGRGGNIGASAGADGVFLVDDQYAPLTERILEAIRGIGDGPVRFVINTHWHGDHTGGNENLGEAGAVIVAHDNVRTRMSTEQFIRAFGSKVPPAPPAALPVITFTDAVTFHLNGDEIHVAHVARAHTDGDSLVHFRRANVLHMGDTFFNRRYPFIDLSSGGSVNGMIAAVERGLALADRRTKVIPGHGPLTDRAGLETYRELLVSVRDRVRGGIRVGKGLEEIQAAQPTAEWDEEWGGGFVSPEKLVEFVYQSLKE